MNDHIDRLQLLIVDLHGTAERLGAMLGLTLDADIIANRSDDHVTAPSVEASIGRWHRDLAEDVAERIWTSLGSRLEALGYSHN